MITDRPVEAPQRFSPRTLALIGVTLVVFGLTWSLVANQPQQAILAAYPQDAYMALYFAVEHLPTEIAIFSAVLLFVRALQQSETALSFGFSRFPLFAFAALPFCIIAITAGNALWQLGIRAVLGIPLAPHDTAFAEWWVHAPLTFWTLTAIYCVIAPPIEEALFRGVLFQWLLLRLPQRWGMVLAVLLSSVLFAVVHVDMIGAGGYVGLAVCSALLLRYGRSLWPCIVLHVCMNGLSVLQSMGVLLR